MHRYLFCNVLSTCGISWKKVCRCNSISNKFLGNKEEYKKSFWYFWSWTTEVDCVSLFSLQRQWRAEFILIYVFRHIEFRLVRWNLNLSDNIHDMVVLQSMVTGQHGAHGRCVLWPVEAVHKSGPGHAATQHHNITANPVPARCHQYRHATRTTAQVSYKIDIESNA